MEEIANKYKRQTASRYLSVDCNEITTSIMESETYAVSTKHDGHFYILYSNDKGLGLINHGGNNIENLPLLSEASKLLKGKYKEVILAGELFLNKEGERTRSFDLSSALSEKSKDIHFAAFDIISLNGEEQKLGIKTLDSKLKTILNGGSCIYPVDNKIVESRKDIEVIYKKVVEKDKQEGIVVRSENGPIYKIKPLITLDAVILGYAVGEGRRAGMLKEILVGLNTAPNEFLLLTKVGNGYTEAERIKLLKELEKKKVDSDYIEVSGSNVAFTMVKAEQVIEFSCLDIFTENSKGPIKKMSIKYDKKNYKAVGKHHMASVISPVYLKMRTDKKPGIQDTGISQITKVVSLDVSSETNTILEKSEIISREVYVKKSKGTNMVRKFMIWKTNKEKSADFPAYVYHYTDFSPGRKEMLKKEVKVSNSKSQIKKIFDSELLENVKKGWSKA